MMKKVAAFLLPLAAVAIAVTPLLLNQPFKTQTPGTTMVAFALQKWSPILTVVLAAATIGFALVISRHARWWTRGPLALSVAVALTAAWFARQNPFEWRFNALAQPRYVSAHDASFVEARDLVLAVTLDGDAAAYPVRQMAYHHIVNDRIGRMPAVVTY